MIGRSMLLALLCATAVLVQPLAASNANVVLESGVYKNLVVAVNRDTTQPTDAQTFVTDVEKFLKEGSEALNFATDGKASFGDVTLVIPRDWDLSGTGVTVHSPIDTITAENADILLHNEPDTLPDTLQVAQCGVPGRQIRIPTSFLSLTAEEELVYGTKGRILTHEWAHYRWGAQDEHGFSGDAVYGAGYGDYEMTPTSCAVQGVEGEWLQGCTADDPKVCQPNTEGCLFCINTNVTAANTQASLGYLPALSEGRFCDADTHNRDGPSPQNKLCGQRSVTELMNLHPDFQNMATNNPADISINLVHEPLGRVALLVDTPVPGQSGVLDSEVLLTEIQQALTAYSNVKVAVMAYTDDGQGGAQFDVTRPFDVIEDGQYSDLADALPDAAARDNTPKLSDVMVKVLEYLDSMDSYGPGTLLVMPVTNTLMTESLLDGAIGTMLRDRRIKPLLLFPEADPDLPSVGSFVQWSGSRFLYRNDTNGPSNYASMAAKAEVSAFLGNTFQNDHSIVRIDSVNLNNGEDYEYSVYYQQYVVQHLVAVITSSGPIADVGVQYKKYATYTDCLESDACTVSGDSIHYWTVNSLSTPAPGEEWALQVSNEGSSSADITITWSEVAKVGNGEELEVQVWSSEGRGPVADIPQNQELSLYVSVMTGGLQVLSSRAAVTGTVELLYPDGSSESHENVDFKDDGVAPDLRLDDSVYSFSIIPADGTPILAGTTVTVTELVVVGQGTDTPSKVKVSSKRETSSKAADTHISKRHQSSGLFTKDPAEVDCCGSFVEDPNTDFNHRIAGFNVFLPNALDPIEITRTISSVHVTPTTTTAEPTTTSEKASTTSDDTTTTTTTTTTPKPTTTTPKATTTPRSTTEGTTTTDDAMTVMASTALLVVASTLALILA